MMNRAELFELLVDRYGLRLEEARGILEVFRAKDDEVEQLKAAVVAANEIVNDIYGVSQCDCDPSVGIYSCHVCTIRAAEEIALGSSSE